MQWLSATKYDIWRTAKMEADKKYKEQEILNQQKQKTDKKWTKVGGMFQGKTGNNAQVRCYLNVNGDQMQRSETIKRFYELTGNDIEVNPYKMGTLEDVLLRPTSIPNITTLLIAHFRNYVESVSFININEIEESEAFKLSKERIINQDRRYLSTKKGD